MFTRKNIVVHLILACCNHNVFNFSPQLYREADLHEEKDRISRSLGATRDPNLIQRVLQFAMSVSLCHRIFHFLASFVYLG